MRNDLWDFRISGILLSGNVGKLFVRLCKVRMSDISYVKDGVCSILDKMNSKLVGRFRFAWVGFFILFDDASLGETDKGVYVSILKLQQIKLDPLKKT